MGRKRISSKEKKKVVTLAIKEKTITEVDEHYKNRSEFFQQAAEEKLKKEKNNDS